MSVVIETTLGDLTVDLFVEHRPRTCLNFLKLCKLKYYNYNLFHMIQQGFIAQTGDPTGEGIGGQSVWGVLEGSSKSYFGCEKMPKIKHTDLGLLSMVTTDEGMVGSQFFFTLAPDLDSLDSKHCVIGQVMEGHDVLCLMNDVICDTTNRPYQDVRITHTVILEDPFDDPKGLTEPSRSPSPSAERLAGGRIAPDEEIDDMKGKSEHEIQEMIDEREAKARATILEIVGDLPDAEMAPPENVLFVCKLNPVTNDDDLEIIFSRFGKIKCCEVIRDKKSGDSLQYAFIEFEDKKSCEDAYFKMDNVLIDDRRIHVDFSQSVSKIKWRGKGRGVIISDDAPDDTGRKTDTRDNNHRRFDNRQRQNNNVQSNRNNDKQHYRRDYNKNTRDESFSSQDRHRNGSFDDRRRRDKSPDNRRRDKSPDNRRRDKLPDNRRRDNSPDNRRRDKSPDNRRKDKSPNNRRRDRSPGGKKKDKSPENRRRGKSPEDKKRDKSPDRSRNRDHRRNTPERHHNNDRYRQRAPDTNKDSHRRESRNKTPDKPRDLNSDRNKESKESRRSIEIGSKRPDVKLKYIKSKKRKHDSDSDTSSDDSLPSKGKKKNKQKTINKKTKKNKKRDSSSESSSDSDTDDSSDSSSDTKKKLKKLDNKKDKRSKQSKKISDSSSSSSESSSSSDDSSSDSDSGHDKRKKYKSKKSVREKSIKKKKRS